MASAAELAQGERVADVLLAIEAAEPATIRPAPLVVISDTAAPLGVLGLHVGAQHFRLSIDEARFTAKALRLDYPGPVADALAEAIDVAALMVEFMAIRARARRERQAVEARGPAS